jgi:hypothetical protein
MNGRFGEAVSRRQHPYRRSAKGRSCRSNQDHLQDCGVAANGRKEPILLKNTMLLAQKAGP